MIFDIQFLGMHRRGRFAQCWMAATNPKLFKTLVQRGETENIGISNLCEQMQKELKEGLLNSKSRIPLYHAAQLVYGAVRIYQQQVQFLYEKTNILFFYQSATTRELMLRRPRNSQESYYGKKKKLSLDLTKDAREFDIELPDTGTQDAYELLCLDTQAGKPQDFLLHEDVKEIIVVDEDDDFGIITDADKKLLLDMLVDSQEKSGENPKSGSTKLVLKDITNKAESHKVKDKVQGNCETTLTNDSPSKIPANEPDSEIDIIREAAREDERPLLLNIPDVFDVNVSSMIDVSNMEDSTSFGLLPQPMEIVDTRADSAPTAVVVPNPPGQIDELPLAEVFQPKRKRRTIKFKIDLCTKISFDTFMNQCEVNSTLRCVDPRLDVVSSFKRNFKESSRLFQTPSRSSQLGKEVVLKRLLYLWKNKLEPVTMNLLCQGVRRKDAAFSFYCLMELGARNYVELKKDTETNTISSIEVGPKVLQRLGSAFK